MKECKSETAFQIEVVSMLEGVRAHVQVHAERVETGIPDMSAAARGLDFWLELKYAEFTIDREHDRFRFKETTRKQLDWLVKRAEAGGARCGILGYFRVRPSLFTHYVFFMTGLEYLDWVWQKDISSSGMILTPYVEDAARIRNGNDLLDFISRPRPPVTAQR